MVKVTIYYSGVNCSFDTETPVKVVKCFRNKEDIEVIQNDGKKVMYNTQNAICLEIENYN